MPNLWRALLLITVPLAGSAFGASSGSSEALRAKIEAIQAPDVAWRQIPWKSCLLEGLREARRSGKPLMLWVFIDRPIDDERC